MMLPHKTNQFWSLAIKLLIVSLSFVVIFQAIKEVSGSQWQLIYKSAQLSKLLWIGGFLSLLNWLLEALKWKTLLNDTQLIKFPSAFSETLRAHAVSIITPNKIGEFGAKASFYPRLLRPRILKLTLTGQIYQLFATCIFGVVGFLLIYSQLPTSLKQSVSLVLGILLIFTLILFLFKFPVSWLSKIKIYLLSLANISHSINAKVITLSLLRYVCFSHQFYLLLWSFQSELSYIQVMPIIFLIYFISSFVPTFLILDATLKTGLSLVLLGSYLSSEFIIGVSLLMWIFNFGIPALFGNLLFLIPKRLSFHPKQVL